jgi:hypothetical protein|nr:hypothetical protein [Kofleriaceae bacterium]
MGLDAFVMCACYARGLTAPPPYRRLVHLDDDGNLALDLPWDGYEMEHLALES